MKAPMFRFLHFQICRVEIRVFVHVLQESSGRADDDVARGHAAALELQVLAADDEAGREVVEATHFAKSFKNLTKKNNLILLFLFNNHLRNKLEHVWSNWQVLELEDPGIISE